MKPIELSNILDLRFLSQPCFSPSGERAAFVVATADRENNRYEQRLWLYEDGGIRQLTDLGREGSFQWLDENRILFPAVRREKEKKRAEAGEEFTSLYVLDLRGGEALPLVTLPFAAGSIRVLDPGHLAVTAVTDKHFPNLWKADEQQRESVRKEREENKDYQVLDEQPFWFNGQGMVNGKRSSLFLVSLDPLEIRALTREGEELQGLTVLDGELFYAVQERGRKLSLYGFTLRAVNWKSGEERARLRCDSLSFAAVEAVGDKLWIIGTEGKRYGLNENSWVYSLDPREGELQLLRKE